MPRLVRMTSTSPCPTEPIWSTSCSNRPSPAVAPDAPRPPWADLADELLEQAPPRRRAGRGDTIAVPDLVAGRRRVDAVKRPARAGDRLQPGVNLDVPRARLRQAVRARRRGDRG